MAYWRKQIETARSINSRNHGFVLAPQYQITGPNESLYNYWTKKSPSQLIHSDFTNEVIRSWFH